jgi:hypothetical protein
MCDKNILGFHFKPIGIEINNKNEQWYQICYGYMDNSTEYVPMLHGHPFPRCPCSIGKVIY